MNDTPPLSDVATQGATLLYNLIDQGRAPEALDGARRLLAINERDSHIVSAAAGILIDAGGAIDDRDATIEGKELLERFLDSEIDQALEEKLQFRYCISNAEGNLWDHHARTADELEAKAAQLKPADENAQSRLRTEAAEHRLKADEAQRRQLDLLQQILFRRHQILNPNLEARVLTNYANTLDHMHRTFEAIDHYQECLSFEPRHGLARANYGEAIRRIIFWGKTHRLQNIALAWELLSKATESSEEILPWVGQGALDNLIQKREKLRTFIENTLKDGLETLEEYKEHRKEDHVGPPPPHWLQAILRDRLFLSWTIEAQSGSYEAKDDLFFDSLSTGLSEDDRVWSIELIHQYNSIKEEFATARHLYYYSRNEQEQLGPVNAVSSYGDPEGHIEFGLISGLLKTSFRQTIDIFDKIASFLVVYFKLGDPGGWFSFNNLWFKDRKPEKGKGEVHPNLKRSLRDNHPLQGLRNISRDIFLRKYPGPVKDARNAAVHRWLGISHLPSSPDHQEAHSWNIDNFFDLTFFMLKQTKGAILLLTAAINVEEEHRRADSDEPGKIRVPEALMIRQPLSNRLSADYEEE